VLGMGLLGASVSLSILRSLKGVKVVGYSHRESTRQKAREMSVADEVADDLCQCVADSDVVILASPICTFEGVMAEIAPCLKDGCIVTDVGSTKGSPHKWAGQLLGKNVRYVGSHPIAGSEQRGVEYARDDLLAGAQCIITHTAKTDADAVAVLEKMWTEMGCVVSLMTPAVHDRTFGAVSHVPHITAAALINASDDEQMKFAGKGFIDTTRVASGPANVWSDILTTNPLNTARGVDKVIKELTKLSDAIKKGDQAKIEKLLEKARGKRAKLIEFKMQDLI
jgi:prephenate dehydrogenase